MCKALEELYNDGVEQGVELGEMKGMIEAFKEIEMQKEDVVERIMQKFKIPQEKAEEKVEMYWE